MSGMALIEASGSMFLAITSGIAVMTGNSGVIAHVNMVVVVQYADGALVVETATFERVKGSGGVPAI